MNPYRNAQDGRIEDYLELAKKSGLPAKLQTYAPFVILWSRHQIQEGTTKLHLIYSGSMEIFTVLNHDSAQNSINQEQKSIADLLTNKNLSHWTIG